MSGLPGRPDAHDGALCRSPRPVTPGPSADPACSPRPSAFVERRRRDARPLGTLGVPRLERLDRRPVAHRDGPRDARQRSAPVAQRAVGVLDRADRRARSGRAGHEPGPARRGHGVPGHPRHHPRLQPARRLGRHDGRLRRHRRVQRDSSPPDGSGVVFNGQNVPSADGHRDHRGRGQRARSTTTCSSCRSTGPSCRPSSTIRSCRRIPRRAR